MREIRSHIRDNRPYEARALLEKMLSDGIPTRAEIDFAVDAYIAMRDYKTAYWYAAVACYEFDRSGDALLRLAKLAMLTSSYALAGNWVAEYIEHNRSSTEVIDLLAECYIRQGNHSQALEALRRSRSLAHTARQHWLTSVVEGGRRIPKKDWLGRRITHVPHLLRIDWKTKLMHSPLAFRAQRLSDIDGWLNTCTYVSDERLFGTAEYWQTPQELEQRRQGDCEDFAIWAWVQLSRMGLRARLVLGSLYSTSRELNHAWVCIYGARGPQVLECVPVGHNVTINARYAFEYIPYLSIDKDVNWFRHSLGLSPAS
jgi:predicted transglutaminase-like cysteine proteinase